MPNPEFQHLLDALDGSGSDAEWAAIDALREALGDALPGHLLAQYQTATQFGARASCVYQGTRFARTSSDAVELGKLAIKDRSKVVRYRACALLAYSLNKDAVPSLVAALERSGDATRADLEAAIDAIQNQNHNYFVDRDHSGRTTWNIH